MTHSGSSDSLLTDLFRHGLKSVHGQNAVEVFLNNSRFERPQAVVAIGKAASPMLKGALNVLGDQVHSALIITKEGHIDEAFCYECIEASHPVPDQRSLDAGKSLINFLQSIPEDVEVLALVSGGASALVEVLPEGMGLEDLQAVNQWLLSQGLPIQEMNRVRQALSLIKGGKILEHLEDRKLTQLIISDVEGDDVEIIGSGLFVPASIEVAEDQLPGWIKSLLPVKKHSIRPNQTNINTHVIASNEIACNAVRSQAEALSHNVKYHGQELYGDVREIADKLAEKILKAEKGIHVWGGEPTVCLPENPGRGGRNQALALELACRLQDEPGITVLVGATDGTDGPTEDAGAIITGMTIQHGEKYSGHANDALGKADAGSFLEEAGALLSTGPTGTNVMDLVIAHIDR